jgi:hypothetical protein
LSHRHARAIETTRAIDTARAIETTRAIDTARAIDATRAIHTARAVDVFGCVNSGVGRIGISGVAGSIATRVRRRVNSGVAMAAVMSCVRARILSRCPAVSVLIRIGRGVWIARIARRK